MAELDFDDIKSANAAHHHGVGVSTRYFWRDLRLETVYDWLTVAIFAGLITLFLQRSSMAEPVDTIYHYFPPAIGCAVANYFGNKGDNAIAIVIIVAILGYIWLVLRPLAHWKP